MNNSEFSVYWYRSVLPSRTRASLWISVALVWFGCLPCLAQGQLLQPLSASKAGTAKTESSADQTGDAPADQAAANPGISFGMTVPSDWEFGLQIDSPAEARGIKATFPVPRAWPEQEVEVVQDFHSDNVSKFERKKPTQWTEQFAFSINRMLAGQSEKAYVRFRIKKKMIQAPKDTTVFVKAKKVPGKYKEFLNLAR